MPPAHPLRIRPAIGTLPRPEARFVLVGEANEARLPLTRNQTQIQIQ